MPLRIVPQQNLSQHDRAILFERRQSLEALVPAVRAIMDAVRAEGDIALRRFTERFDGAVLHDLAVSDEEFARAREVLDAGVHEALGAQVAAVRAFHTPQLPAEEAVETV